MQIFGASGHASRPQGSTLAAYTACYPEQDAENAHVKSIVNMDHVWHPGQDPHHFKYYVSSAACLPSSFFAIVEQQAGLYKTCVHLSCSGNPGSRA